LSRKINLISRTQASEGIYCAESSRLLYERSCEHFGDAEDFFEGSHMVKHWMTSQTECMFLNTSRYTTSMKQKNHLARVVIDMDNVKRNLM
jgi:hypothetical protein